MRKLRLLLWQDCDKNCKGCCNKEWELDTLPFVDNIGDYEEILITGGEPMLYPERTLNILQEVKIRKKSDVVKVFMYTAKLDDPIKLLYLMHYLNGITVTIHDKKDFEAFYRFDNHFMLAGYSLRLNVFKEAGKVSSLPLRNAWVIKEDMEWKVNHPLPEGEELKRWKE